MANNYNKNRRVLTYKDFLKKGEKSQDGEHDETGKAELTKDHYSGDKKGDKGIATIDDPDRISIKK